MKMYSHLREKLLFFVCFALFLSGCGGQKAAKNEDSPTMGQISIAVDDAFRPLIRAEMDTFMGLYKYARINAQYLPEGEAMALMLKDSARLAIVTRQLNEEEKAYFEKRKLIPRVHKIAVDAVALIVNKNNADSMFTMQQLSDIFTGKTRLWNQLGKSKSKEEIRVVFDNSNSSNLLYMKEKLAIKDSIPSNIFAVNSNEQVIEYVKKHPNTIGVIGVNWISDEEDAKVKGFRNDIRVAAIANPPADAEYYQPFQGYIAKGLYPLRREVYIISREARAGLGTGFTSFVVSDRGQRLVLKSGLVPATMPLRIVEFKKEAIE